ncbi:unnamed protein product [Auanema sp. JU1783]|nr:unnamed protein product [Auanema sp. JU1783]
MPSRRSVRRSTIEASALSAASADKKGIKSVIRNKKTSPSIVISPVTPIRKHRRSADVTPKSGNTENNDCRSSPRNKRTSVKRKSVLQPSNTDRSAVDTKPSPMKTRRLHKSKEAVPHCTLCFKTNGSLETCSKCSLNYHLQKCLSYSKVMETNCRNLTSWLCPKCVRCDVCQELVDDVNNKECVVCLHAWHGSCSEGKGHGSVSVWTCNKCIKEVGPPKYLSPAKIINRLELPAWSPFPSPQSSPDKGLLTIEKRGPGRPKGVTRNIMNSRKLGEETSKSEDIISSRDQIWDNLMDFHNIEKDGVSTSPRKRRDVTDNSKKLPNLAIEEDRSLYESAKMKYKAEMEYLATRDITQSTVGKWVYIGGKQKMKALYESPYPEDVRNGEFIFICPFCLFPTSDFHVYRLHRAYCPFHHPPGNEIYRDEELSFFEVDGAAEKHYCRNLCLLAKLFISSKTLHHEVDTFLFYILTEITEEGCRIVGYFSKEKNPSKNNNLSCLLTLPSESRKGFGRLLIDMSYQLSALELKVGSPEHPLSDLGLFAYRGYWRSSILCYLRSVRNLAQTSVKSMSLSTRIHPTDIVNQLLRDKLLLYKEGNYYVKTGKRAYKWPLSMCRRRIVRPEKLHWKPSYDISQLDPTRLNYYV